jgi:O-antigen/teichoic acid export membrane protein
LRSVVGQKFVLFARAASFGERLRKSHFAQGVLAIAGGTAIAQAINVLAAPVLTRLYTPEQMGQWGLFLSFIGVAAVTAALRYEVAIVGARTENDARALTRACIQVGAAMAFLAALALELLRRNNLLGYGALSPWAIALAIPAVVGSSWTFTLRQYALRHQAFVLASRQMLIQGATRPLLQILFTPAGTMGLMLAETFSRFQGIRRLWRGLPLQSDSRSNVKVLAAYSTFPTTQLPSALLDSLALLAPVPVFTAVYGPSIAGAMTLAQRVMALPISLIGNAVADVFYARMAILKRENPHQAMVFFCRTLSTLCLIALPYAIGVWALAPTLVPIVFGQQWADAGPLFGLLAPWYAAMLVVSPLSRVVFLSQYMWIKLLYDAASILIVTTPLFLPALPAHKAVLLVSTAKTIQLIFYGCLLAWLTGRLKPENANNGG